jgi:endonuclease/exonuclease/phosphatase family metal-dependent hydrolase
MIIIGGDINQEMYEISKKRKKTKFDKLLLSLSRTFNSKTSNHSNREIDYIFSNNNFKNIDI